MFLGLIGAAVLSVGFGFIVAGCPNRGSAHDVLGQGEMLVGFFAGYAIGDWFQVELMAELTMLLA